MAHYDDVILPTKLALGSGTGPSTSTDVVFVGSGYRYANARWSQKLRRFNIGYNVRSLADAYAILKIFEAVDGPGNSFLVRDWNDWNTTEGAMGAAGLDQATALDQPLQNTTDQTFLGDGATTTFQMVKRYTVGANAAHTRTINKPQSGSVLVAVDGATQSEGGDYTVDYATGIVTFTSAPGAGVSPTAVAVTWGGAFRVPVSFVGDEFLSTLETFDGSAVPNIQLVEERL